MGLSRLGVLGAFMTTAVTANAVLPLIAKEELIQHLPHQGQYQLFLDAVSVAAFPFLLGSLWLLKGLNNRLIATVGFLLLFILNMLLYVTDLSWHPLALRLLIGGVFGLTIPMGQFSLAEADLEEHERVNQFTMMLNLVAVGLTVVPFVGIFLLSASSGDPAALFLFLSVFSLILAISSYYMIPAGFRVRPIHRQALRLQPASLKTVFGDGLIIVLTRSMYALVLVLVSQRLSDYAQLQMVSLCFTLPFVFFGFVAIPWLRRLSPGRSFVLVVVLPLLCLAPLFVIDNLVLMAALLLVVALLSVPEAFTPGQLVSQWQQASGRQFGNILSMALLTICLSIGPALLSSINHLAVSQPILNCDTLLSSLIWFLLIVPLSCGFVLRGFWQNQLIPRLLKT